MAARGRALALALATLAALVVLAPFAYAADTVSATATVSGSVIDAQAVGTAQDCGSGQGCSGQTVTLVVQPYATPEAPPQCAGNSGSGVVVAQQTLPATGGPFNLSGSTPETEGAYTVCAYLVASQGGGSVTVAASNAVLLALAPQPCPTGSPQPLSLRAPAKLARGQHAVVAISDRVRAANVESVVVTMRAAGDAAPFRTYTFTAAEFAKLERGGTETVSTRVVRGSAATVVAVSYEQIISTITCTAGVSADIAAVPGSVPVARFEGGPPGRPGDARIAISGRGGCDVTAAVPASVLVAGTDGDLRASAKNVCGHWQSRGRIRGISLETTTSGGGTVVELRPRGGVTGTFRVAVTVDGRTVKHGLLRVGRRAVLASGPRQSARPHGTGVR